jgi:hypothetical protein
MHRSKFGKIRAGKSAIGRAVYDRASCYGRNEGLIRRKLSRPKQALHYRAAPNEFGRAFRDQAEITVDYR